MLRMLGTMIGAGPCEWGCAAGRVGGAVASACEVASCSVFVRAVLRPVTRLMAVEAFTRIATAASSPTPSAAPVPTGSTAASPTACRRVRRRASSSIRTRGREMTLLMTAIARHPRQIRTTTTAATARDSSVRIVAVGGMPAVAAAAVSRRCAKRRPECGRSGGEIESGSASSFVSCSLLLLVAITRLKIASESIESVVGAVARGSGGRLATRRGGSSTTTTTTALGGSGGRRRCCGRRRAAVLPSAAPPGAASCASAAAPSPIPVAAKVRGRGNAISVDESSGSLGTRTNGVAGSQHGRTEGTDASGVLEGGRGHGGRASSSGRASGSDSSSSWGRRRRRRVVRRWCWWCDRCACSDRSKGAQVCALSLRSREIFLHRFVELPCLRLHALVDAVHLLQCLCDDIVLALQTARNQIQRRLHVRAKSRLSHLQMQ